MDVFPNETRKQVNKVTKAQLIEAIKIISYYLNKKIFFN